MSQDLCMKGEVGNKFGSVWYVSRSLSTYEDKFGEWKLIT